VPGFFGLGTALEELIAAEGLATATRLYTHHALFRTLVDNSMQSMAKCDFRLTLHAERDPRFAAIRAVLQKEFHRTERNVLAISGQQRLLEHSPLLRDSIALRNAIILPLLVILQASLARLREADGASESVDVHRRLAARSMFGIVNASRNAG
jgi:phosphoenolpyruvate carboxylase